MAENPLPPPPKLWDALLTSAPETVRFASFNEERPDKPHKPSGQGRRSKFEDKLAPLHCLALMGYSDVITDMLRSDKVPDLDVTSFTKKWTPLMFAIQGSQLDVVRQLLDNGANVNHAAKDRTTPLHLAVTLGCLVTTETLLRYGARVDVADSRGDTPLHICMWHVGGGAATFGPLERHAMARALIQAGAAVHATNKIGDTALHVCLRYGHDVSLAEVLLSAPHAEQCLKIYNDTGHIPLQMTSDLVTMEMLLMRGSPIDYQGRDGRTILHMRAAQPELVTLLIDHKADVMLRDKQGQTALHLVVANHSAPYQSMCHLLMSMPDVNVQDNNGNTALHLACYRPQTAGDSPIIDLLLNKRAAIDLQNSRGETALYICLKCGHQKYAAQLLSAGASPDVKDKKGNSSRSIDPRWVTRALSGRPGRIEGTDGDILIDNMDLVLPTSPNMTHKRRGLLTNKDKAPDISNKTGLVTNQEKTPDISTKTGLVTNKDKTSDKRGLVTSLNKTPDTTTKRALINKCDKTSDTKTQKLKDLPNIHSERPHLARDMEPTQMIHKPLTGQGPLIPALPEPTIKHSPRAAHPERTKPGPSAALPEPGPGAALLHPRISSIKHEHTKTHDFQVLESPPNMSRGRPRSSHRSWLLKHDPSSPQAALVALAPTTEQETEAYIQNALRWRTLSTEEQLSEFRSNFRSLCREVASFRETLEEAVEPETNRKQKSFLPRLRKSSPGTRARGRGARNGSQDRGGEGDRTF